MATLLDRLRSQSREPVRHSVDTIDDFLLTFGGHQYPLAFTNTWQRLTEEAPPNSFESYAQQLFASNPVVFGAEKIRMAVFSQARLRYRSFRNGRPQALFGDRSLALFERPWPGGTTLDLLARMLLYADVGGNAYVWDSSEELHVWRPDRVTIVMGSRLDPEHPGPAEDARVIGYIYTPGPGMKPRLYPASEVAHFAPVPDPVANFRGMSWLTPVVREIQADKASTEHKWRFFQNAAPQPLDAKILTPTGWSTMGEMAVGCEVIGSDGRPHRVTGVYPQGVQDIYRVRFGDGASVECTADHLWAVSNAYDRKRGVTRTMSLAEMVAGGLHYRSGPAKWAVPLVDPVEFQDSGPLPVDPYLMGLLLGDGSFRSNGKGSGGVSLACAAEDADETQAEIEPTLPDGVSVSRRDRGGWSEFYFKGPGAPRPNPLTSAIRALGLFDVLGAEKFIPERFLRASIKERVSLLQGLIDSDGHVGKTGVRFTTTSERLATDVSELVTSLGGVATVRRGHNRSTLTVAVRRLPEWIVPARLARKASQYRALDVTRARTIVGVEWSRSAPAQCIRVDVDDHLYVTDGYVLTHNTPNIAIRFDPNVKLEMVRQFKELMEDEHQGLANAYKTLYLGGGADLSVIGKDFQQLEFATTQGKGETRILMAAGVHATIVGASEGMQGSSLNAGNYSQVKRLLGDIHMQHLWRNAVASLSVLVNVPAGAELWFDTSDIPFLQDDIKDTAEVQVSRSAAIRQLVDGGFEPQSVVDAIEANDFTLLRHTGKLSVQLQEPGAEGEAGQTGDGGKPAAAPQPDGATPRELTEMVQKVYLGVDKVITSAEAREILNRAGAGLPVPGPDLPTSAATPGRQLQVRRDEAGLIVGVEEVDSDDAGD